MSKRLSAATKKVPRWESVTKGGAKSADRGKMKWTKRETEGERENVGGIKCSERADANGKSWKKDGG